MNKTTSTTSAMNFETATELTPLSDSLHKIMISDIDISTRTSSKEEKKMMQGREQKEGHNQKSNNDHLVIDWLATHCIGILVASYWRGTWILLDIYTCQQPTDATLMNAMSFCFANDFSTPIRILSGWISYGLGYVCLAIGLYLSWKRNVWNHVQYSPLMNNNNNESLTSPDIHHSTNNNHEHNQHSKMITSMKAKKALQRFVYVYILGFASANVWRGIWYLSDAYIWTQSLHKSLIFTTIMGIFCAILIGCGNSLLAPPACFIVDGIGSIKEEEGHEESSSSVTSSQQPPLLGTILNTFYSTILPSAPQQQQQQQQQQQIRENLIDEDDNERRTNDVETQKREIRKIPRMNWITETLDFIMSFFVLPIFVVWFWRGSWGLLDVILWGYTTSLSLHLSLLFGTIIAILGLYVGSLDITTMFVSTSKRTTLLRVQTIVLAISTVSFWRVVWYAWDEFMGGSTLWSGWTAHLVGVFGLSMMGCMSCILASPTVLAVDANAHPDAAYDAYSHDVPIRYDVLHFLAISQ